MPNTPRGYFRYFADSPDVATWGLAVTAAGCAQIPAGAPYPPEEHPADHDFSWARGRVLEALQIVLITAGRGLFESRATGRRTVEAGTAFALLPREWHRYRPDRERGWEESWLEVRGPVAESLIQAGIFRVADALRPDALGAGLETALEALHTAARSAPAGFDPGLSALALGVLAAWAKVDQPRPARSRITRAVLEAQRRLTDEHAQPVNIAALAADLGVAYSHFRRVFKAHTGFAPWQYVLHVRLSRARRLLGASDATLDDVAALLGFSSGFHLSSAFKQAYGLSPERWRRQLAQDAPEARDDGAPGNG